MMEGSDDGPDFLSEEDRGRGGSPSDDSGTFTLQPPKKAFTGKKLSLGHGAVVMFLTKKSSSSALPFLAFISLLTAAPAFL